MAQNWHNEYADRKNGRKPVIVLPPRPRGDPRPTYGLMIYQEQLMRVSQKLAGYSLEEADNLRKARGKKNRELIAKERKKFVDGCERNGHGARVRRALFRHDRAVRRLLVQQVAHASATASSRTKPRGSRRTIPVQYLAALLTSVKTNLDKAAVYLNECRQLDIPVLVPDVNASESDFSCEFGDG